jgi:hypothetical protein
VIGPPQAPAVIILFLDWQLEQEMDSAFLVFDLVAGNAGLEVKGDTRNLIYPKRDDRKKAIGLIGREESQSRSGRDRFAEFRRVALIHFAHPHQLMAIRHCAY